LRKNNITPILGLLGVLAVCCGQPSRSADAGPDAGPAGGLAEVWIDAGPQPLPDVDLVASWDGGKADLEIPDASISPTSQILLRTSVALDDCRVRVLDDDDRMLPNHAAFRRGDAGTTVDMSITKALPSKRCCRLVVDGELGDGGLIVSSDRHYFQPLQVRFGVWPQPTPPPSLHHHRRHHRSR
jgi:hypothetical protein